MDAARRCSSSRSRASSIVSRSADSPPASPLVQHTSQPVEPPSIHAAAVPAGPKSASSGWATMTMNRSRRHACELVSVPVHTFYKCVCTPVGLCYDPSRGFARLPPRAKPLNMSGARLRPPFSRARRCGSRLLDRLEHLRGMPVGLDLRPGTRDPAVGVDEEARALDPHRPTAVVVLLHPGSVRLRDAMVDVGQERERQAELGPELRVTVGRVRADALNLRGVRLDPLVEVAELAGLGGATGRVISR